MKNVLSKVSENFSDFDLLINSPKSSLKREDFMVKSEKYFSKGYRLFARRVLWTESYGCEDSMNNISWQKKDWTPNTILVL